MFPADDILLARGKYSTLGKERRQQLERVQKICTTLMTTAAHILKDCEGKPPSNDALLETVLKCHANLTTARNVLIVIAMDMEALKPLAWDGTDER